MAGSGFEQMDFLQCCKFAEGDSRILMLKMARDRLSVYRKNAGAIPEVRVWSRHHLSLLSRSLLQPWSVLFTISIAAAYIPACVARDTTPKPKRMR